MQNVRIQKNAVLQYKKKRTTFVILFVSMKKCCGYLASATTTFCALRLPICTIYTPAAGIW